MVACCLPGTYKDSHAFSSFANWLIPGRLLMGRYPYVEPSRCRTHQQGEQQLEQIITAGITTFISLQVDCGSKRGTLPAAYSAL